MTFLSFSSTWRRRRRINTLWIIWKNTKTATKKKVKEFFYTEKKANHSLFTFIDGTMKIKTMVIIRSPRSFCRRNHSRDVLRNFRKTVEEHCGFQVASKLLKLTTFFNFCSLELEETEIKSSSFAAKKSTE